MAADWFRRLKHRARVARAIREIEARAITPRPHGLDAPVVVSLTSYPARFPTLALTLKALLRQTVRADCTILWLEAHEAEQLPEDVLALQKEGLDIRGNCPNIRSYKKIIPALGVFPDACIVTADDDLYYGPRWLGDLTTLAAPARVVAHRAHRVTHASDGLAPYAQWRKNVAGATENPDLFATGAGGVLYPPHSLHPDVTRQDLFTRLCPSADDVWLWWMARMAGSLVRHIGPKTRVIEWPDTQTTSLRSENLGENAGNDRAVAAMIGHYGVP